MNQSTKANWERAQTSLMSAKQLVETDPESAASRAYYAAFHALTALFSLRGQTFKKHSAIRAALHRDLVRPGILDSVAAKNFEFVYNLRETSDYGGLMRVPVESARMAADKAGDFLAAIERACPEVAKMD